MATITSSGIGSGLDVNSLVTQLVAADRAPEDSRLAGIDTKLTPQCHRTQPAQRLNVGVPVGAGRSQGCQHADRAQGHAQR